MAHHSWVPGRLELANQFSHLGRAILPLGLDVELQLHLALRPGCSRKGLDEAGCSSKRGRLSSFVRHTVCLQRMPNCWWRHLVEAKDPAGPGAVQGNT